MVALASIPTSSGYDLSLWLLSKTGAVTILGGDGPNGALNVTLQADETVVDGVVSGSAMYLMGEVSAKANATTAADGPGYFVRRVGIGKKQNQLRYQFPRGTMKPVGVSKFSWQGGPGLLAMLRRPIIPCGAYVYFLFVSSSTDAGLIVFVYDAKTFHFVKRGSPIAGTSTVVDITCVLLNNKTDTGRLLLVADNGTVNMSPSNGNPSQYFLTFDAALIPLETPVPVSDLAPSPASSSAYINAAVNFIQQSNAVALLQFSWGTQKGGTVTSKALGSWTVAFSAVSSLLAPTDGTDGGTKPVPNPPCNSGTSSSSTACATDTASLANASEANGWTRLSEAAKVAVVIVPILVLIIAILIVLLCIRRKRRRSVIPHTMPEFGSGHMEQKETVRIMRDSLILKRDNANDNDIKHESDNATLHDDVTPTPSKEVSSSPPSNYSFPRPLNETIGSHSSEDTLTLGNVGSEGKTGEPGSTSWVGDDGTSLGSSSRPHGPLAEGQLEWDPNLTVTRERGAATAMDQGGNSGSSGTVSAGIDDPTFNQNGNITAFAREDSNPFQLSGISVVITAAPVETEGPLVTDAGNVGQRNVGPESDARLEEEDDKPLIAIASALGGAGGTTTMSAGSRVSSPAPSFQSLHVPKINGPGSSSTFQRPPKNSIPTSPTLAATKHLLTSRRYYDDDYLLQLNRHSKAVQQAASQGMVYHPPSDPGKSLQVPSSSGSTEGSIRSVRSGRNHAGRSPAPSRKRRGHVRSLSSPNAVNYDSDDVPLGVLLNDGTKRPPPYPDLLRSSPIPMRDAISSRTWGSGSASGSSSQAVSSSNTSAGSMGSAKYPRYPPGTLLSQGKSKAPPTMIHHRPDATPTNLFLPPQFVPAAPPEAMLANMQQMWASTTHAPMPFVSPHPMQMTQMYPVGMYPQMPWQAPFVPQAPSVVPNMRHHDSMHVNVGSQSRGWASTTNLLGDGSDGSRSRSRSRDGRARSENGDAGRGRGESRSRRRSRSRDSSKSGSSGHRSEGGRRSRSRPRGAPGDVGAVANMQNEYFKLREKGIRTPGSVARIMKEGSSASASGSSDGRPSLDGMPRGILKQRRI
ncbi:hypothetical protein HDV00_007850 [Rhizophlyctis rosea]|nr:hypothetical protein HDV00_007850 [Rhizophlyctis rosea]